MGGFAVCFVTTILVGGLIPVSSAYIAGDGGGGGVTFTTRPDYDYDRLTPEELLPEITSTGSVIRVVQGESVTLPCDVIRMSAKYNIVWQNDSSTLWVLWGNATGTRGTYHVQMVSADHRISNVNTSLVLNNVTTDDEGIYRCDVAQMEDEVVMHQLVVRVPPTASAPPYGNRVEETEGSTAKLACVVSGNPRPTVTWEKEDGPLPGIPDDTLLTILNVTPADSGIYICIAANGIGTEDRAYLTLNVHYAPRVSAAPAVVYSGVGYDARITCKIEGSRTLSVGWYRDGNAPVNPMRLTKTMEDWNKYSLYFERVLITDFGFYSCNASNFWGNGSSRVELSGRPQRPRITSDPQGMKETSFSVTWDVISYAPVISYDVLFRNVSSVSDDYDEGEYDDNQYVNVTVPGLKTNSMYRSQRYTLHQLVPDSQTLVKIRAHNEFGSSHWSYGFMFSTAPLGILPEEELDPELSTIEEEFDTAKLASTHHPIQHSGTQVEKTNLGSGRSHDSEEQLVNVAYLAGAAVDEDEENSVSARQMDLQNASSSSSPNGHILTKAEKRAQMAALITAISLSAFFL